MLIKTLRTKTTYKDFTYKDLLITVDKNMCNVAYLIVISHVLKVMWIALSVKVLTL